MPTVRAEWWDPLRLSVHMQQVTVYGSVWSSQLLLRSCVCVCVKCTTSCVHRILTRLVGRIAPVTVYLCVCVCVRVVSPTVGMSVCVCVCVCEWVGISVCVCVCESG